MRNAKPGNHLNTENVEMRRLCNFPHETGLFHLIKKDDTDIQCFLKNNKIERVGQVTGPLNSFRHVTTSHNNIGFNQILRDCFDH